MENKFKLLIFSASLALPRAVEGSWTSYEETWPAILKRKLPNIEINHCGIGSGTTSDLVYQLRYWKAYQPDMVILQAGLGDCVPRAFKKSEIEILNLFLPKRFVFYLTQKFKVKLRSIRNICHTNKYRFRKNILRFNSVYHDVYALAICSDRSKKSNLPGYIHQIESYNHIIRDCLQESFINLDHLKSSDFVEDGFHLSKEGHIAIAKKILNLIRQKFPNY